MTRKKLSKIIYEWVTHGKIVGNQRIIIGCDFDELVDMLMQQMTKRKSTRLGTDEFWCCYINNRPEFNMYESNEWQSLPALF